MIARIKQLEMIIGGTCLLVMFLVICANIVSRYVFNIPLTWVEELSNFLFIWVGFLSALYALSEGEHLRIGVFVGRLSPSARRWIEVFNLIVIILVFVSFVRPSVTLLGTLNTTAAMRIPEAIPYAILPLFMILGTVQVGALILSRAMTPAPDKAAAASDRQ